MRQYIYINNMHENCSKQTYLNIRCEAHMVVNISSSGITFHVIWQTGTNTLEKHATSDFRIHSLLPHLKTECWYISTTPYGVKCQCKCQCKSRDSASVSVNVKQRQYQHKYQCKSRDSASVSTQQKRVHIIVAETERR